MKAIGLGLAALVLAVQPGSADGVADFYRGKLLDLVVGSEAGGSYDVASRALARHFVRHVPGNPGLVVRNMPGASSLTMTNWLYNIAARDGTVIGMPNNSIVMEPLMGSTTGSNMKFETARLAWIGTPVQETFVTFVWSESPFRTVEDLKTSESLMAGISADGENMTLPTLMNALAGMRMRVVKGYGGQAAIFNAIERGEAEGNTTGLSNLTSTKSDWLRDGKIRILLQFAEHPNPRIPEVPLALDLVGGENDRDLLRFFMAKYRMARPLTAPPGVPQDRLAALRDAFDATMKDPAFLADAGKIGLDINPLGGADLARIVAALNATPAPIVERTRALLGLGEH